MKRFLLGTLMLMAVAPAWAASAKLTTSGSDCTGTTTCLTVSLPQDKGGAGLTISGTWTGTITFEATTDGGTTWVAINVMPVASTTGVSTTTGNGLWQVNTTGLTGIRMRPSATVTGTAVATITTSYASFAR